MYFVKSYILSLGVLGMVSCTSESPQKEVIHVPVSVVIGSPNALNHQSISLSGKVESSHVTSISTRVMGYVEAVNVKVGDRVKKGQSLIQINSADVKAKQAQVASMISEAKVAYDNAQKDLERFETLHQQKSATDKELENVQLQFQSMKSKYQAAQDMKEEVEVMFKYTNIVAPYDGQVTQKMTEVGNIANPGMPLLMIEHAGDLEVSAWVSEQYIGLLKEGQTADVKIKAIGKSFLAKISQISLSSASSGGQYVLKLSIPSSAMNGLLSGMYADITVSVDQKSFVNGNHFMTVPVDAIVYKDHLTGIYIVSNGIAYLRWIRLGKIVGDEVQVLSGLSMQDKYVLNYEGKMYNGCEVTIK